jgi:hypothetical protein
MALPIQYQPFKYQQTELPVQLVPLLGASAQRSQQRYDTTNQSLAAMNRELDETDTYDPETKEMVMGKIKSKIDEIDQRYNGDMSAGMNDYIQLIGKAKNDPYWGLAKKQIENVKRLNELKDRFGADLLVANDPTQQKLFNSETGRYVSANELEPITLRRSELEKDPLLRAKELSQIRRELGVSKNPKLPGYLTKTTLTGLTPQEVERRFGVGKENEGYKMAVQQLNSTPTLNNYLEKQGISSTEDKLKWIQSFNYDVLKNNLGYKYDTQELVDQDYVEGLKHGRTGTTSQVPYSGVYKIDPKQSVQDVDNKFAKLKVNINPVTKTLNNQSKIQQYSTLMEEGNLTPEQEAGLTSSMQFEMNANKESTPSAIFDKLKSDHSLIYNKSKNDEDFINTVQNLERENAKVKHMVLYHPDEESQDYFVKGIARTVLRGSELEVKKLDENYNPTTKFWGKYKGDNIGEIVDSSVDLYNGQIIGTNKRGEKFAINKNNLGEDVEHSLTLAQKVLDNTTKWNNKAFEPVVDATYEILPNNEKGYPIYVKTQNNTIKQYMSADPEGKDLWTRNGKPEIFKEYTPQEFSYTMMDNIYKGFNVFLKKNK